MAGTGARTEAGRRLAATASRPARDALHRLLDAAPPDVAHVHHVFVEDGRTGPLVPPGDPAALAAAMAALAGDPDRSAELGRAARRRVVARHDPGRHVDALLDCYRRAMARAS
jgi:hypothetical protein